MKQVELADREQQDPRPQVEGFFDQIIDMGEFEPEFNFPVRAALFANAMFDFDFRGEFHMFGDVRIDERHEPLLVEVAVEPAKAVLNAALPVRPKLEIHIAADNGLRRRDERFGVDQAA